MNRGKIWAVLVLAGVVAAGAGYFWGRAAWENLDNPIHMGGRFLLTGCGGAVAAYFVWKRLVAIEKEKVRLAFTAKTREIAAAETLKCYNEFIGMAYRMWTIQKYLRNSAGKEEYDRLLIGAEDYVQVHGLYFPPAVAAEVHAFLAEQHKFRQVLKEWATTPPPASPDDSRGWFAFQTSHVTLMREFRRAAGLD